MLIRSLKRLSLNEDDPTLPVTTNIDSLPSDADNGIEIIYLIR